MRRRLVREFPLFFFYLAFHVVNDSTGLVFNLMYGGKSVPYVYSYWVGQAIGTSLRFVVIYEVFLKIFEPYDALQRAGSIIFRCATLFLLLVALLAAVTGGNGDPQWAIHGVVTLDRSINVVPPPISASHGGTTSPASPWALASSPASNCSRQHCGRNSARSPTWFWTFFPGLAFWVLFSFGAPTCWGMNPSDL